MGTCKTKGDLKVQQKIGSDRTRLQSPHFCERLPVPAVNIDSWGEAAHNQGAPVAAAQNQVRPKHTR